MSDEAKIIGCKISLLDTAELLADVAAAVADRRRLLVASGNIHSLNIAQQLPWYREFLNQADIVRLDGAGVGLAARILGNQVPARSTWGDFAWAMAEMCAKQRSRWYLLGGEEGVAEAAGHRLQERHPDLRLAGTHHGYFEHSSGSTESQALIEEINESKADILTVGLGMPLQETWIRENQDKLNCPVIMTAGAVWEYVAGSKKRAPAWMLNCGMEWAYRLMQEPGRLWTRYLLGNTIFFARVLMQKIRCGTSQNSE